MTDVDPGAIVQRALSLSGFLGPIHVLDKVGSTQDEAGRLAAAGAEEGTVVVARTQNRGRGRHGRDWFSPPGTGFYGSVVLRPGDQVSRWPALSVLAGAGLAQGLVLAGIADVRLKWPNDCLVAGRKVAGILAEAHPESGYVILGLGLNLSFAGVEVPLDQVPMATDIATHLAAGRDLEETCAMALAGAVQAYEDSRPGLEVDGDKVDGILWTRGTVTVGGVRGRVAGIHGTGALVLVDADGRERRVADGEVSNAGSD